MFARTSGREVRAPDLAALQPTLILDALIGYGLTTSPRGVVETMIDWANACDAPTVSLDLPSGANATTGTTPGAVIRPAVTLTLALPKTGLAVVPTGVLFLADLGIPPQVYKEAIGVPIRSPFGRRFWVRLRPLPLKRA